jgi:hypothetical protein
MSQIIVKVGGALTIGSYGLLTRRRTPLQRLLLPEISLALAGNLRIFLGSGWLRSGWTMYLLLDLRILGCRQSPGLHLLCRGHGKPLIGKKTDHNDQQNTYNPSCVHVLLV